MGSAGVARHVWSGMAVAGLLLAALVWLAWPEAATPAREACDPVTQALNARSGALSRACVTGSQTRPAAD
ncbi:MAG: hypothetical protein HOQ03_05790, partial [Thermoleophilia bacterium]|nr:hypothetical protein [Thermoleophilia bacterium]